MEIIKEIKTAEKDAKQIIEKAQAKAVAALDNSKKQRGDKLENQRLERRKIIDNAVKDATAQAEKDVAMIISDAKQERDEIAGKGEKPINHAVEQVLDFINTLTEK